MHRLAQVSARMFFVSTLVAAVLLSAFSLNAFAVPPRPGQEPVTNDDSTIRRDRQTQQGQGDRSIEVEGDWFIDMRPEINSRINAAGGQYIMGREVEVMDLADRVRNAIDPANRNLTRKIIAIIGDPGAGKTGTYEEFMRQNPDHLVFRLNLKKLSGLSGEALPTKFKELLMVELPKMSARLVGSQQLHIFVPDMSALLQGNGVQPMSILIEQAIAGLNAYVTVETSPRVYGNLTDETKSKYADLSERFETVTVKSPQFTAVDNSLMAEKSAIENRMGVEILTKAVHQASEIATARMGSRALTWGRQLLERAADMIKADQKKDSRLQDRLVAEVNAAKREMDSLYRDLKGETDAAEIKDLRNRIAALKRAIRTKTRTIANLTIDTGSAKKKAELDLRLVAKRRERDQVAKEVSFLGKVKDPAKLARIDQELSDLGYEAKELEQQILKTEDTNGRPATKVGPQQIVALAAEWLKIPAERLTSNYTEGLRRINDLNSQVVGQEHVVEFISKALSIAASNLDQMEYKDSEVEDIRAGRKSGRKRPVARFIFAGPTGVGKTEMVNRLADLLGVELSRFDMSEFKQSHQVARLIGAPPGYLGFGKPGEFMVAITKDKQAIILLDEIEKADASIYDVLLQVLDNGRLTDSNGEIVDFRSAMVIMTSNLGQEIARFEEDEAITHLKKHGKSDEDIAPWKKEGVHRLRTECWRVTATSQEEQMLKGRAPLRPEFVGRADVVVFNALDKKAAAGIATKTIKQFVRQVKHFYKVELRFTDEALAKMVDYFNEAEGGRSMERAFDSLFRGQIAEMVVEKGLKSGDTLVVSLGDNSNELLYLKATAQDIASAEAQAKALEDAEGAKKAPPAEGEIKQALRNRRSKTTPERQALLATTDLVRKVIDPEFMIRERAFKLLPRR